MYLSSIIKTMSCRLLSMASIELAEVFYGNWCRADSMLHNLNIDGVTYECEPDFVSTSSSVLLVGVICFRKECPEFSRHIYLTIIDISNIICKIIKPTKKIHNKTGQTVKTDNAPSVKPEKPVYKNRTD